MKNKELSKKALGTTLVALFALSAGVLFTFLPRLSTATPPPVPPVLPPPPPGSPVPLPGQVETVLLYDYLTCDSLNINSAWGCPESGGSGQVVTGPGDSKAALVASPDTIAAGDTSTLTWTSENTTSCTINHGVETGGETNGNVSVTPVTTTEYQLTCVPSSGGTDLITTATVNVTSTALACTRSSDSYTATPGRDPYTWMVDGAASSVTTDSLLVPTEVGSHWATVSADGETANCPLVTVNGTVTNEPATGGATPGLSGGAGCVPEPVGSIIASASRVSSSDAVITLSWSISGYKTLADFIAANCTIMENGTAIATLTNGAVDSCNTTGTLEVSGITKQTTYSISCEGVPLQTVAGALAQVLINLNPQYNEF